MEYHRFQDSDKAREKGVATLKMCAELQTKDRLSPFGKWACDHVLSDLDTFITHAQIQLVFRDQDGKARSFTLDRKAPLDQCTLKNMGMECTVPGDEPNEWEAWLDNGVERVARALNDPVYSDEARLVFAPVLGFLPAARLGQPLRDFITPQGESVNRGAISTA